MPLRLLVTINEDGDLCGLCPFVQRMRELALPGQPVRPMCRVYTQLGHPVTYLHEDKSGAAVRCGECRIQARPRMHGVEWS